MLRGMAFLAAIAIIVFPMASAIADADSLKMATVYIEVGYNDGSTFHKVGSETGFLISADGRVFTLDHVAKSTDMPPDKIPVYLGSAGSESADQHELYPVPSLAFVPGAQLLKFSPNLHIKWKYFKILVNHTFTTNDQVVAYGFPFISNDIETRKGSVSNVLGPNGSIGVDMELAPGMSGGPVTLGVSRCVVAVVAYGSMLSSYNYVVPIQQVKPLLDVVPAEYVTKFTINSGSTGPQQPELYDKSFPVRPGPLTPVRRVAPALSRTACDVSRQIDLSGRLHRGCASITLWPAHLKLRGIGAKQPTPVRS